MGAPYRLSEGLYLEKSGVLLPWFQSLHQITKIGGKPLPMKGKVTQLFWESESVLEGLEVDIQAMSYGSGLFNLTHKGETSFKSAQDEYESTLAELKSRFGEPHESGAEGAYPWVRWRWEDVCLSLVIGERFVDYVAMSVSKAVVK